MCYFVPVFPQFQYSLYIITINCFHKIAQIN